SLHYLVSLIALPVIVISLIIAFFVFVRLSDPLKVDGWSIYNEEDQLYMSITNTGNRKIKINSVTINDELKPKKLSFVMSYTGQIVSGGIEDNPKASFVGLGHAFIYPKLSGDKIHELVNDNEEKTP